MNGAFDELTLAENLAVDGDAFRQVFSDALQFLAGINFVLHHLDAFGINIETDYFNFFGKLQCYRQPNIT